MSIGEFISQKNEIERLNKQIDMIAGFYAKELNSLNKTLLRATKQKNEIKCKYEKLKARYVPKYKGNKEKAMELIGEHHSGSGLTLVDIAKKINLGYSTIRGYSSEYLTKLKVEV